MRLYYYDVKEWSYKHTPGEEKMLALWAHRISPHTKQALPLSINVLSAEDQTEESTPEDTVELVSGLEDYGLDDMHEGLITIPQDDFIALKETLIKSSTAEYLGVVIILSTEASDLNEAEISEFSFELSGKIVSAGS
jgi:hypothetical protein